MRPEDSVEAGSDSGIEDVVVHESEPDSDEVGYAPDGDQLEDDLPRQPDDEWHPLSDADLEELS